MSALRFGPALKNTSIVRKRFVITLDDGTKTTVLASSLKAAKAACGIEPKKK